MRRQGIIAHLDPRPRLPIASEVQTIEARSRLDAPLVFVAWPTRAATAPCSGRATLDDTERIATQCTEFGGRDICLGRRALKVSASDSQKKTIKSTRVCTAAAAVPESGGLPTALRRGMPPKTLRGMAATATALTSTTSATRAEGS